MQKGAWGCEAGEASRDDGDDDDDMFGKGGWKRGSNLELGGGPSVAGDVI